MIGVYRGWRVQGNEQEARRLGNFLVNTNDYQVKVESPFSYVYELMLQLEETRFRGERQYDRAYHNVSVRLPKTWKDCGGEWARVLDKPFLFPKERFSDEAREQRNELVNQVVKYLRELDGVGIALPHLPGLETVPEIVSDRASLKDLEEKEWRGSKLSDFLEAQRHCDFHIFGDYTEGSDYGLSQRPSRFTQEHCALSKGFVYRKKGTPVVEYKGELHFSGRSVWIENLSLQLVGKHPEFEKSDFEEKLPWEIKDIERQLEPTDRFRIHRMSVLGKEPYRGMKQVEHDPHGLLITVPSPRGAFYNPTYSENERVNDLAEMEALAEWLIENNQATKTKVAVS